MTSAGEFIAEKLSERYRAGNLRSLKPESRLIDFCSNDYLGFARSGVLKEKIDSELRQLDVVANGSTGSRLISGNYDYAEALEAHFARVFNAQAALIFNSGYDANLGLFSSLPQKGDTVITDELIHASITDGTRLSFANRYTFVHNDLDSLENKLKLAKGICYVVAESVYSMDGDLAPLEEMIKLTERYNAHLIVDEAHATGLFGLGLVNDSLSPKVFARIVTFGKALGCHGAVVLGSDMLKQYLVNFCRPFIYTTAPPLHQLVSMKIALGHLAVSGSQLKKLSDNINLFKLQLTCISQYKLISSESPIQCIVYGDNGRAVAAANKLKEHGIEVRPILSPTVKKGTERLRICIHAYNTEEDILLLTSVLNKI